MCYLDYVAKVFIHYMLQQPFLNLEKKLSFRYPVNYFKEKELKPSSTKVLIHSPGAYQATF